MLSVLSAAQREDAPSDVSHRRIDVNPSGKYPRGFRAGVGAPARGGQSASRRERSATWYLKRLRVRGVLTVPVAATTVGDARGNGGHEGVPDGHLPHAGRVLTRAAHLGGSDIIKVGPRRSHGDALTGHFIGDTEDTELSGRFF